MKVTKGLSLVALLSAASGCGVPREAGFPEVNSAVEARTGHQAYWNQGGLADDKVARAVAEMLAHDLGNGEVVQIALLNNRTLQESYEELSISQADLVSAGLLQNPTLSGGVQFPLSGEGTIAQVGIEQDLLSLLLLPSRKRVASAAFEATKKRVAHEVVAFVFEVRSAIVTLQGATLIAAMQKRIAEAAETSAGLAKAQHDAGNINDLDLESELALLDQARLDLAMSEGEVVVAREALTRLMGLWGKDVGWTLARSLPGLPSADPAAAEVESFAIAHRLDVEAARREMEAQREALTAAHDFRYVGGASVGADLERDIDGVHLGPTASVELPIFDQKQAAVAHAEAMFRKSENRLYALSVNVRSEVREARARVGLARKVAEAYRDDIIPRRERLVALTQQEYDAMLTGVFQVITAKQEEIHAYREYVAAVRDYWIARADLDRVAGGRLEGPDAAAPPEVMSPSRNPTPPAAHDHAHAH